MMTIHRDSCDVNAERSATLEKEYWDAERRSLMN